jgi:hypothetical protein
MSSSTKSAIIFTTLLPFTFGTIVFDPVHNTCGPNTQQVAQAVLSDVVNMAQTSGSLMERLQHGNLEVSDPWEFLRVMETYNTFFDGVTYGMDRFNNVKGKLPYSSNILHTYLPSGTLAIMANLGSSSPNIFIACDEGPFWDTTQDGNNLIFHDPDRGRDEILDINHSRRCSQAPNMFAYRTHINNVNYIFAAIVSLRTSSYQA